MTEAIAIASKVSRIINKAELAELFDVTLPAVEHWVRKGCPVVQRGGRGVSWQFDILAVAEWRFVGIASNGDVDPDTLSPVDRKNWYEGETKKRDLQIKDRSLIPAEDVERAVSTAFASLSQDIRAIPDNLERKHGISPEVAEAVELALYESMEGIMNALSSLAPVGSEK